MVWCVCYILICYVLRLNADDRCGVLVCMLHDVLHWSKGRFVLCCVQCTVPPRLQNLFYVFPWAHWAAKKHCSSSFFQQVRNRHGANGTLRDGVHPLCCILKQALLLKLILVNSMIFSHRNVCLCECVCVYGMTAVLLHFAPHVRLISELHCHDTACITCLYTCTYAFTADEWAGVCSFETTLHFVLQLK